jgi:hypothetical protein
MAVPASFDESNAVLGKPPDMGHDECTCLSVLRTETESGTPVVVSCWKLTHEELEEVCRTGRVWLTVVGETMPPVAVDVTQPF